MFEANVSDFDFDPYLSLISRAQLVGEGRGQFVFASVPEGTFGFNRYLYLYFYTALDDLQYNTSFVIISLPPECPKPSPSEPGDFPPGRCLELPSFSPWEPPSFTSRADDGSRTLSGKKSKS